MIMRLESVDNPTSVGNTFVGKTFDFRYDGTRFYFGSLYSSTVQSTTRTDTGLDIQTRNTLYKFVRKM